MPDSLSERYQELLTGSYDCVDRIVLNAREILRERTRAGLAHARENGERLGRPATAALHAAEIRKLHRAGVSKSEIARRLQIGRTSVRRILGARS